MAAFRKKILEEITLNFELLILNTDAVKSSTSEVLLFGLGVEVFATVPVHCQLCVCVCV